MRNSNHSKIDQQLLNAILEMLIDNKSETPEEVDERLHSMGLDLDAMRARINVVVQDALATSPFNWRVQEREKIEKERQRYEQSKSAKKIDRAAVISRINQIALAPSYYRNLEEESDEDLVSLLQQMEFLADANQAEE